MFLDFLNRGSGLGANVIRLAYVSGVQNNLLATMKLIPIENRAPPHLDCLQHLTFQFRCGTNYAKSCSTFVCIRIWPCVVAMELFQDCGERLNGLDELCGLPLIKERKILLQYFKILIQGTP